MQQTWTSIAQNGPDHLGLLHIWPFLPPFPPPPQQGLSLCVFTAFSQHFTAFHTALTRLFIAFHCLPLHFSPPFSPSQSTKRRPTAGSSSSPTGPASPTSSAAPRPPAGCVDRNPDRSVVMSAYVWKCISLLHGSLMTTLGGMEVHVCSNPDRSPLAADCSKLIVAS